MKLLGLRIKGFQQFQDLKLDFFGGNGEPLKKVCFIGKNGTGKSVLLELLNKALINVNSLGHPIGIPYFYLKYRFNNSIVYLFSSWYLKEIIFLKAEIELESNWFETLTSHKDQIRQNLEKYKNYRINSEPEIYEIEQNLRLNDNSTDLLIYSPPEEVQNTYLSVNDVPNTNLDDALKLLDSFSFQHIVSIKNVHDFWKVLIFLIKKRDNEREIFETKEENINKTKKQLIQEFDNMHPKILEKLAVIWNKILEPAGLEFDCSNAINPVQLNDNLKAYIKLKSNNQRINYNQLSTGIRNFIFRVGHIYSLYFNRTVENGFLLLDEPENSLFPDFLFDLIETYEEIVVDKNGRNNTQFFIATHSPIIAAQFDPEERIILEWNEDGFVDAYKGIAPAGDDPNDILKKDFKLRHLMGKRGQEMWDEYIALRKKLRQASNHKEKNELLARLNKIGNDYNFKE